MRYDLAGKGVSLPDHLVWRNVMVRSNIQCAFRANIAGVTAFGAVTGGEVPAEGVPCVMAYPDAASPSLDTLLAAPDTHAVWMIQTELPALGLDDTTTTAATTPTTSTIPLTTPTTAIPSATIPTTPSPSTTTSTTTTTSTSTTTSTTVSSSFAEGDSCSSEGAYYPDQVQCNSFLRCDQGIIVKFQCSGDLHWFQSLLTCNYPDSANCVDDD
ncbi:integumentary mucin A.1-like [Scylla paramamosain]|uniref:integumentary mucin A.1-like n=1 Tax=Scylla paramamosain TaxID=85552 RepID=UPI003082F84F